MDSRRWLARQHYYDYYLYTGDRDFLVQRVIPFMKEVVDFYEDFLTLGPDGTLVSSPSTSPENTANPGYNQGSQLRISINATMDIAVAREVFTHLAEACDETGDAAESARCRRMLAQMPEYQINEDGAVKEWMHPDFLDNYRHRHQSHLYPRIPGLRNHRGRRPRTLPSLSYRSREATGHRPQRADRLVARSHGKYLRPSWRQRTRARNFSPARPELHWHQPVHLPQ